MTAISRMNLKLFFNACDTFDDLTSKVRNYMQQQFGKYVNGVHLQPKHAPPCTARKVWKHMRNFVLSVGKLSVCISILQIRGCCGKNC